MNWFAKKRAEGAVRRSQILTRAGPGACVDLVDHAVVINGLDDWQFGTEPTKIVEPRLTAQALRILRLAGHWHHAHVDLRLPPICDDDDPSPSRGLTASSFPSWYLCQNGKCRSLINWRALDDRRRHVCSTASDDGFAVVPVRFVSACDRGHLTEIHWRAFVHRGVRAEGIEDEDWAFCNREPGSGLPNDPLEESWNGDIAMVPVGTSGDMADYVVWCRRCGARRGLQDLAIPDVLGRCRGWRPWLGFRSNEECSLTSKLLIRTATNAWFPINISALSLRDTSMEVPRKVESLWSHLKKVDSAAKLTQLIELSEPVERALAGLDPSEVLGEIRRRQLSLPLEQPTIREAEWRALTTAPLEIPGELPARGEDWFAARLDATDLPPFIERVVLVHAMKEVRAQVGFTRHNGLAGNAEGEPSADDWERVAPLSLQADWIPAVEIRGEGVFIAFDEDEIRRWEANEAVVEREALFRRALLKENEGRSLVVQFEGARLLMLHSLAHMLISSISVSCGYPASSIRERIYCYRDADPDPLVAKKRSRAGILLYTGTPGSEGTLGGLVAVGRDIVAHLRRAVESALLCSNDPICSHHDPAGTEEGRRREGAACHACLLIAEPSCERMNQDLDRTFVVPTVARKGGDFLGAWMGVGGG